MKLETNKDNLSENTPNRTLKLMAAAGFGGILALAHILPIYGDLEVKEYLTDFYIAKSIVNQEGTAEWANKTIDQLNSQLEKAGANKRVKSDKVIKNYSSTSCPPESMAVRGFMDRWHCKFPDNKLRVWLRDNPLEDEEGRKIPYIGSWANISTGEVRLFLPVLPPITEELLSEVDSQTLRHELIHLFDVPDYYIELVWPQHNLAMKNRDLGILPHTRDIMFCNFCKDIDHIDQHSTVNIINQSSPVRFTDTFWYTKFQPEEVSLKVLQNSIPKAGIRIEAFTQQYDAVEKAFVISDKLNKAGFTNLKGEMNFSTGDFFKGGNSVFLKFYDGGEIRYGALTRSRLYSEYFKGNRELATIPIEFKSLAESKPGQITFLIG